eukprot:evm.model.scf_143.3 EVM.evm.TU.scf_143.3   scf_143:62494-65097(-)
MAPGDLIALEGAPDCGPVHWLPCKIAASGPARVGAYFQTMDTDEHLGEATIQEAAFRGRRLKGVNIPLPANFAGHMMELKKGTGDDGQPCTEWRSTGTFHSIKYWNHDTQPSTDDLEWKSMEWLAVSEAVMSGKWFGRKWECLVCKNFVAGHSKSNLFQNTSQVLHNVQHFWHWGHSGKLLQYVVGCSKCQRCI